MTTLSSPQQCPFAGSDSTAAEIQSQVWGLVSSLHPHATGMERRRDQRYPFPYLIHLTPVGDDGITPEGEAIVVVGKHLSQRGLGVYHPTPLAHRRVIASLQVENGEWFAFLVDVSWCRFTKKGWYESGGRFLQAVASPMDSEE
ncbi:MAG: hypothetical protein HQ581_24295 [Planctomycetes bacterium]|nr:hypothetical protein [Planctomycetota bacterium]